MSKIEIAFNLIWLNIIALHRVFNFQRFLLYNLIYQHFKRHSWLNGDTPDIPLTWVGVLIPFLKLRFLDISPMVGFFSPVTFFVITPDLHPQWSQLKTTINTNNYHDQQCIPNAKKMQSICILHLRLTPRKGPTNSFLCLPR